MKEVDEFLKSVKIKCESTAKKMNTLELSIWNEQHEKDLIKDFGFTEKTVKQRKKQLEK